MARFTSFKVSIIGMLALLMMGCSPESHSLPNEPPPSHATEMQEALQKPINATSQAIDQVNDTQQRMDAALEQLDNKPPAPLID